MKFKNRKITFVSGSNYLALPTDWICHHNLKPRDELRIEIDDQERLIITKENETKKIKTRA